MSLVLRNPHSVLAALETRPQDVVEVCLHANSPSRPWEDVINLAASHRRPVRRGVARPQNRRDSRESSQDTGTRLGSAYATVKERTGVSLGDLFAPAQDSPSKPALWIALDCLQDPHNVGAIFRCSAFFDVQGIITTKKRSAPLSATVYDVASGGVEYVPFAEQTNLARALDVAKQSGLWILGTSEHASSDVADVPHDRPWLLVLGNEEKGLRRLTLDLCDEVCKVTARGPVGSLNVSVAAGILISTLSR